MARRVPSPTSGRQVSRRMPLAKDGPIVLCGFQQNGAANKSEPDGDVDRQGACFISHFGSPNSPLRVPPCRRLVVLALFEELISERVSLVARHPAPALDRADNNLVCEQ